MELSALSSLVKESVEEVVTKQCAAGVDVINDGEQSKVAYAIYVKDRLSGFEDRPSRASTIEDDFPEYTERLAREGRTIVSSDISLPVCVGPIAYTDHAPLHRDLDNLRQAMTAASPHEVFMTAASPGLVAHFCNNEYYASEEA